MGAESLPSLMTLFFPFKSVFCGFPFLKQWSKLFPEVMVTASWKTACSSLQCPVDRRAHHLDCVRTRPCCVSSGDVPLACLTGVFQWQIWHTQPQASKPQSSARVWSGDLRADQVKESHSLVLSCVTGEFVLCGPTEVFATWATSPLPEIGTWMLNHLCCGKTSLKQGCSPHDWFKWVSLPPHRLFLGLGKTCLKIEQVPNFLSGLRWASAC